MAWNIIESVLVWVLTAGLGFSIAFFKAKFTKAKKEENALKHGMQSLLRSDIIKLHDKFMEKGYAPIYAKEAMEKSYIAYHNLGGNGVMTNLYDEMMELPNNPIKENKNKEDN